MSDKDPSSFSKSQHQLPSNEEKSNSFNTTGNSNGASTSSTNLEDTLRNIRSRSKKGSQYSQAPAFHSNNNVNSDSKYYQINIDSKAKSKRHWNQTSERQPGPSLEDTTSSVQDFPSNENKPKTPNQNRGRNGPSKSGPSRNNNRWNQKSHQQDPSLNDTDPEKTTEPVPDHNHQNNTSSIPVKPPRQNQRTNRRGSQRNHQLSDSPSGSSSSKSRTQADRTTNNRKSKNRFQSKGNQFNRTDRQNIYVSMSNPNTASRTAILVEQLSTENYECMVCFERIRRDNSIWSCETCWTALHMRCIIKWSKTSSAQTNASSSNELRLFRCPACQNTYPYTSNFEYRCFCKRRKNPESIPGQTPHSCGEVCRKSRAQNNVICPHPCTELCHPGPCPPCTRMATPRNCHCTSQKSDTTKYPVIITLKCSDPVTEDSYSCGRICGNTMKCKLPGHTCSRPCHSGDCGDCQETIEPRCFCGKESALLPCSVACCVDNSSRQTSGYSCGGICDKTLQCGNHKCTQPCHMGDCQPCPLSPSSMNHCACGKMELSRYQMAFRITCTDPIPSCGQNCGKSLSCSFKHGCTQTCGHSGDCGPCNQKLDIMCACGGEKFSLDCKTDISEIHSVARCHRKCGDRLNCRAHFCTNLCCPLKKSKNASTPIIWDPLRVDPETKKLHTCDRVCEKQLNCGIHTCDVRCGHPEPCLPCGILIRSPLSCECGAVSIAPPVRCGTVPPPCTKPCSKVRDCGHPCPDKCHTGACPKCVTLVKRSCYGGHDESRWVQCWTKDISCGRECGRILACKMHTCRKKCHIGPCEECVYLCGLPRKVCGHPCQEKCHVNTDCPSGPCQFPVEITCHCGRIKKEEKCLMADAYGIAQKNEGVSYDNSQNLLRLRCDDECDRQKRIAALGVALGITQKEETKESIYSEFLRNFAESNLPFVASIEHQLISMIKNNHKKISFQAMPSLHRMVVHELTNVYGLESSSRGDGIDRYVQVWQERSHKVPQIPSETLTEFVKNLNEQKRRDKNAIIRSCVWVNFPLTVIRDAAVKSMQSYLRPHIGHFEICKEKKGTFLVKFSTPERLESFRLSCLERSGISLKEPTANDLDVYVRGVDQKLVINSNEGWGDETNVVSNEVDVTNALQALGNLNCKEEEIPEDWNELSD